MSTRKTDLSGLAEAVADGDAIDWEREARIHGEAESRLRGLQVVHSISEFYRATTLQARRPRGFRSEPPTRVPGYEMLGKIGEGGMGVVYQARQESTGDLVAVKLLPEYLAADEQAQGLFMREAILGSTLDHPNVTRLLGSGEADDGRHYFASELLVGFTLQELLRRELPSIRRAVDIARQTAAGLAAAHARGVIHRDIKPSNLMLVEDGRRVKILDFGLARLELVSGKSLGGWVLGTVTYASPEHIRGEDTEPRSDLWSLGVVLYEMTAGRPPFGGDDSTSIVQAVLHQTPEPLRSHRPEAPEALVVLVDRLLAKEPRDRIGSADELCRQLGKLEQLGELEADLPADPKALPGE